MAKSRTSLAAVQVNDVQEVKAFTEASKEEEDDHIEPVVYTPSLLKAAFKAFGKDFVSVAFLVATEEMIRVVQPVCLGYYMAWFSDRYPEMTATHAWIAGAGIVACAMMYNSTHHAMFFLSSVIGMRFRIAFSSLVYRKTVRLNQSAFETSTSGQMVNLLSNDVARFDLAFLFIHYIWVAPIQVRIFKFQNNDHLANRKKWFFIFYFFLFF